jgi:xanthine dehydrogenase YagR molybdenum-binding subunit
LKPNQLELRGGRLAAKDDPARAVTLAEVMSKAHKQSVEATTPAPGTPQPAADVEDHEDYQAAQQKYAFQSFGCHFVEVHVEEPLARVRVKRVVSAMDVGRILNPKTSRSQVIGGVIMGLGMALMEGTEYDRVSGRPINASLADYAVCVNPDVGSIETHFIDIPDVHMNKLGCRGVGEIGITGVAAAVANAVYHATGKRVRDLPITPDKLL